MSLDDHQSHSITYDALFAFSDQWSYCVQGVLLLIPHTGNKAFVNYSNHRYLADNLGKTKDSIFASGAQGNLAVSDAPSPLSI